MKLIFSDFDGTLTNNNELSAVFFDLLNLLKKHNKELIIVSGRSVSWGHFLLTHFPLKFAIMEGGGVILTKNKDIEEEYLTSENNIFKLKKLEKMIKEKIKEVYFSKDSLGRITDRAVEYSLMNEDSLKKLISLLDEHHAHYSKSNVHINFWYGEHSKFTAAEYFLNKYFKNNTLEDCLYFGDALNDESMFQNFPHSVGVSNIQKVLSELKYRPSIILKGKENEGTHGVFNYLLKELNTSN